MGGSQFFCTGCGKRLSPGKRFCTQCGKPVAAAVPRIPVGAGDSLPPGLIMGGRWRIEHLLGRGGMGAVYRVQDIRFNNRRAALKEMLDRSLSLSDREEAIARFQREAETLAALNHANIPHIYDRFSQDDRVYMVMEFIEGIDLERQLTSHHEAQGCALPEKLVAHYAYQLSSVLAYLHKQQPPTLHRDLKPSNLIYHSSGTLKLIDFGIAKVFNPGSQGTGLGTQGYAAPEQYKGLAEPRTDLYSLGATLHHLLTGRDPRQQTPFDFPPATDLVKVDAGFSELLTDLLALRPENRPHTAEVVRLRLLQLYPGIPDWQADGVLQAFVGQNTRGVSDIVAPTRTESAVAFAPLANPAAVANNAIAPQPPAPANHASVPTISDSAVSTASNSGGSATSSELRVPPQMDASQPLELLSFDDQVQEFALLGVVNLAGLEFAFVTAGNQIQAGRPVEVYLQRWQGDQAWFEPIAADAPELHAKVQVAWQALQQQS